MIVQRVVRELRAFMASNSYSQTTLSEQTGIPQPTISRALSQPKRVTATHRALCKFAGISLETRGEGGSAREELMQTVFDVWDGSREHAQTIARLLRAAATLEAYGAARASRPTKTHGNR